MLKQTLFLLLLGLVGLTACTNDNTLDLDLDLESEEAVILADTISPSNRTRIPENTISLATFNTWNTNWESHWNDKYISYFTMPLSNLQNLISTLDVEAARLYLGYSEEDGHAHLTLVGVDANEESMLGVNDYIYNFAMPCPEYCGDNSLSHPAIPSSGLTEVLANTISETTFNEWNTNWESRWDDSYIKYFTMPLSNLQNLVNTNGVVAARFYLGYSEEDGHARLTLVGVDAEGQSMLGVNANIYDFTRPCPQWCPGI